jgi:hypothetical protein
MTCGECLSAATKRTTRVDPRILNLDPLVSDIVERLALGSR